MSGKTGAPGADPFKKDPLYDDPELRKKYEEYLKEHKERVRELEFEQYGPFLERPRRVRR